MKNKNIIWMLLMICSSTIFAQKPTSKLASLEVIVVDSTTKKPIEFAVVTIESLKYKKAKYTNRKGVALFQSVIPGVSILSIKYTGYQIQKIDLNLVAGKNEQKKILMSSSSLNEVFIIEGKSVLIDKDEPNQNNYNNRHHQIPNYFSSIFHFDIYNLHFLLFITTIN